MQYARSCPIVLPRRLVWQRGKLLSALDYNGMLNSIRTPGIHSGLVLHMQQPFLGSILSALPFRNSAFLLLIKHAPFSTFLCFRSPRGIAHWDLINLSRYWVIKFVSGGKLLFEISRANMCKVNIWGSTLDSRKVYYLDLTMELGFVAPFTTTSFTVLENLGLKTGKVRPSYKNRTCFSFLPFQTQTTDRLVIMIPILICFLLAWCVQGYTLVHDYDYRNWYESFTFETVSSILSPSHLSIWQCLVARPNPWLCRIHLFGGGTGTWYDSNHRESSFHERWQHSYRPTFRWWTQEYLARV